MNKPIIGERFGRYTVIEIAPKGNHYQQRVKCRCDCGTVKVVDYSPLRTGRIISCGCYGREKRIEAAKHRAKGNQYRIEGNIAILSASNNGMDIVVDTETLSKVLHYTWRARCLKGDHFYAFAREGKELIRLHRLLAGLSKEDPRVVDHINGDTLDNRLCNLRICEQKYNCVNRIANKHKLYSKFKGVYSATNGRTYFSSIEIDGETKYLGSFNNEIDAAKAYDDAARKQFGEYAKLNFPNRK